MNKICTDIRQSKKLIELGIDRNTADMLWTYDFMVNDINGLNVISELLQPEENDIPAWSLTALLGVLPKGTRLLKSVTDDTYHCDCPKGNIDKWFDNPIDAAFEIVCWLKENGKI